MHHFLHTGQFLRALVEKESMRLRIVFSKTGALRYTGHLDLHSIWERTIRRTGLPLAYSQGFHPQPRIQLACALPLGFTGRAEIMDMWLNTDVDLLAIPGKIQQAAPLGLAISSVAPVDEHSPALQTQVVSAEYEVVLLDALETAAIEKGIATLLASPSIPRERRGKAYDLRPLIVSLALLPADGSAMLRISMHLAAREGATGRPEEVLESLGIPVETARIERTRLVMKNDIK
jgi:radical SAM-linked protein